MTIPFLSYFKKGKGNGAVKEKAAPEQPAAPLEKPSSERFSKTVMPNATRTLPPTDPFEMAARSTALGGQMPTAVPTTGPAGHRTISFSPSSAAASTSRDLPRAVALALEPDVERVIALQLGDVITEMPEGYIKPMEVIDTTRRVLLKAAEVEKGMAKGKPSVSLVSLYKQVPEIFVRKIADADTMELLLPFNKVLDGLASMQVRADQERANAVPQVETPFLKVTLEDNATFGTTTGPLETNELPAVRVEMPTAKAFADFTPEAAADAIVKMAPAPLAKGATQPRRIPFKLSPNGTDVPAPESVPASSGPSVPNLLPSPLAPAVARIDDPGQEGATPKGPGSTLPALQPAPENRETKMPPTFGAAPAPVRIPFKLAPAPILEEAKPKPEPWLTKESFAAPATETPIETPIEPKEETPVVSETAPVAETKIALPLLPILKSLPPMQLTGDPSCVPPDVRLQLPFALIEPQLASGRVSVTAKVFEVSMPVSFRGLFKAGEGTIDVALPLQEVLKNLPTTSLRMRDDQEEQDAGQNFATPFSAKAEEDAKRFNIPAAPVAKAVAAVEEAPPVAVPEPPVVAAVPAAAETKAAEADAADTAAATGPEAAETDAADTAATTADEEKIEEKTPVLSLRTPLQVALDTDEKLDAKGVVALVNKMAGVKACSILFGDGLSLAGSLPAELETDGICAMAPALMQRIENHLVDTKLGGLRGMTLACAKGAITFYMHENLCLAALHAELVLPNETREKLSRVVHELSRKYSHPI